MNQPGGCPQFQTRMESIPTRSGSMIVPVRRCLLTERAVVQLRSMPEARENLRALVTDPLGDPLYCAAGPDLEVVEFNLCTVGRCSESCSPAFRSLLAHFGVDDPNEIDCGVNPGDLESGRTSSASGA